MGIDASGVLNEVKLLDFVSTVTDARPIFVISVNSKFNDIYTLPELALCDTLLSKSIFRLRIRSVNGKPTYILDVG